MYNRIDMKKTLLVLCVSVFPLILVSLAWFFLSKEQVELAVLGGLDSLADAQEARVNQIVDRYNVIHDGFTSRTQFRVSLNDFNTTKSLKEAETIKKIITDAARPFDDIKNVIVISKDGKLVTSTQATERSDFAETELFKKGQTKYLIPAERGGEQFMTLSKPIVREGTFLGVLAIEFSAASIKNLTTDYTGLGQSGETTIAFRDESGIPRFLGSVRFPSKSAAPGPSSDNALAGVEEVLTNSVDYRGNTVFAALRHVESANFGLVVKKDRSEVLAPFNNYITISLFFVVITLTVVLYLIRII